MKIIIIFFTIIAGLNFANAQQNKDTVFLVREFLSDHSYHAIFFDSSNNSGYINTIKKNSISKPEIDSLLKQSLEPSLGKVKKYNLKNIATIWLPLYLHNKNYYLYDPSDPGESTWVGITDTTILQLYFDLGIVASNIQKVKKINPQLIELNYYNRNLGSVYLKIHIIDQNNGIAVFEYPNNPLNERYMMMVKSEKSNKFPIIVNYCNENKMAEFEFEKPDFPKIIKLKRY